MEAGRGNWAIQNLSWPPSVSLGHASEDPLDALCRASSAPARADCSAGSGGGGIQYDALSSDVSGEDSSPDFFWDAAARITATGWVLEIRVPFSSLRYEAGAAPVWRVLLYRNYPRDFRYQMFTSRLPRGSNCFICHSRELIGLQGLPAGGHLVVAPYATAERSSTPRSEVGSPLEDGPVEEDGGLDLKWTPQRRHRGRSHRQPRFLADRVGRRTDLDQRTLRSVRAGEAAVLPRAARPALDAAPGGLHPQPDLAALGRPGDRYVRRRWGRGGRHLVHGAGGGGPRRRQRHRARPRFVALCPSGLRLAGGDRAAAARPRPLLREPGRASARPSRSRDAGTATRRSRSWPSACGSGPKPSIGTTPFSRAS